MTSVQVVCITTTRDLKDSRGLRCTQLISAMRAWSIDINIYRIPLAYHSIFILVAHDVYSRKRGTREELTVAVTSKAALTLFPK